MHPSSLATRTLRVSVLLLVAAGLAACASAPAPRPVYAPTPAQASRPATQEANDVLFHAIGLVGTPYRWGGNTPSTGFDCSGLVDYVYRTSAGIDLPRTSHQMSRMDAPKITRISELDSGDLLFFRTEGRSISHVAIYVGKGRFVHAPNSGGTVRLDNFDNHYWHRHFAFARRVIR
jgi:cell wall-associated NlpC family hydrolase